MNRGQRRVMAVLLPAFLAVILPVCRKPNRPPEVPAVPVGPSAAREDSVCTFATSASDPDGDDVAIRFSWGDGDTSDWSDWVPSGETVAMDHSWSSGGAFEVRAGARDRPGLTSDWSAPLVVTITGNLPPDTPSMPDGPAFGGRGETLSFAATATDPDGDSVRIRFCWGDGDTSAWSSLVRSGDTVPATHAWRDTGSYRVAAQARDAEGLTSGWSPSWPVAVTPLKWRSEAGRIGRSSPAIAADGTVYIGSRDNHLYAFNPDGTLKWRYETDDGIDYSSPAIAGDGTVYVASRDNHLYAVNPDGTLKWRYETARQVRSSPAIAADGTVYIGSRDNHVYAVNPDGTLKWRYRTDDWLSSSPVIAADGTVYIGSRDRHLYAFDPDGILKWRYETGGSIIYSSPAIAADGTVYVGSRDHLYAFNPDGTLKWRYETGRVYSSPAIAADGTVYVGSRDHHLYAVNPDGTLKWRYETGGQVRSSPAIAANGTVYFGSDDHHLHAVRPDGSPGWRCRTGGRVYSSPAIAADGTVYVGSYDLYYYAIEGDSPLADTPWPKHRHDNKNTGRVRGP